MSRIVHVAQAAEKDVADIFSWLSDRSATGAKRWYDAWLSAAKKLESAASYGTPAPEGKALGISLSQVFFPRARAKPTASCMFSTISQFIC